MNIHADAMIEYAKDWAETDEPWERWEYRFLGTNTWGILATHPSWAANLEYRRKLQPESEQ